MDSVYSKRKNAKLENATIPDWLQLFKGYCMDIRNYQEPRMVKRRGST